MSVLPIAIKELGISQKLKLFKLLTKFSKLVALTFSWPQAFEDVIDACDYVHSSRNQEYFRDLWTLAKMHINVVNSRYWFCTLMLRLLNGPNTNFLLDLYVHTAPLHGRDLFLSDLRFEANHEPLKASLSRNKSRKSHISAVYHILGTDW